MKKLLVLLSLVLFTGDFYGQVQPEVFIEPTIQYIVDEYVAEAAERCIDVTPHIDQMKFIGYTNLLSYPTLGIATKDGKIIAISQYCSLDRTILKTVVFHELTHSIFNEGHSYRSQYDIMRDSSPLSFRIYDDIDFWEARLDEIFKGKNSVLK